MTEKKSLRDVQEREEYLEAKDGTKVFMRSWLPPLLKADKYFIMISTAFLWWVQSKWDVSNEKSAICFSVMTYPTVLYHLIQERMALSTQSMHGCNYYFQ